MAKKRKAARTAKKKSARKSARKTVRRAAARKPARSKRAKKTAKPQGIGARIAGAVGAVLGTLTDAEQLHARTARKAGFQELE